MLIPRITRGAPDKIFMICRNLHSATLGHGEVVRFLSSADTPPTGYTWIPGVDVLSTAALSLLVAGVTHVTNSNTAGTVAVAIGDYFTCQVFGYHSAVKTTAAALAAGTILTSDAAGAAVAGATADDPNARMGVSLKTGASNKAGVQLRCM